MVSPFIISVLVLTGGTSMACQTPWVLAHYVPNTNIIVDCEKTTNKEMKEYILNHEIAHYIWFNKLNELQRKKYIKLWTRDYKFKERMLDEYSATNYYEGFANDYAVSLTNGVFLSNAFFNSRVEYVKSITKFKK